MNPSIFSSALILLHLLLLLSPSNADLIHDTCQNTSYPDLCTSSLQSDPRGSGADVKGLALIMVDVISYKATLTSKEIEELIRKTSDPKVKQQLNECVDAYSAILKGDVPMAIEGLKKGNYKFAEQGANDAATEADFCEKGFGGKSPLSDKNKLVHDVSSVTASIVKLLL